MAFTSEFDGTVTVWSVDTGKSVCKRQAVMAALSPDGKRMAYLQIEGVQGTVIVEEIATKKEVTRFLTIDSYIYGYAMFFSPNGGSLV